MKNSPIVSAKSRNFERRLINLPKPAYPEELPVVALRQEIAQAIQKNQVVIISGETGSGKTTQLPKIYLELERGRACDDRAYAASSYRGTDRGGTNRFRA